jgi:hypothetical protein
MEVAIDGSTLSPRQRVTAMPYALNAAALQGHVPADFADAGHLHDFMEMSGTVSDAQVPDNITVNYAADSGMLAGRSAGGYLLSAGDTVAGALQVNGHLEAQADLIVSGDASIMGGNIGLGQTASEGHGILNQAAGAPGYGAYLHGNTAGLYGAWSGDPEDHYGYIGSENMGLYLQSGDVDETEIRYGAKIRAISQNATYGLYSSARSSYNYYARGVVGFAHNDSNGHAIAVEGQAMSLSSARLYGGYFVAQNTGTGVHYGILARAKDYAGWFEYGRVHIGSGGVEDHVYGDGDLYVKNNLEVDGSGYVKLNLAVYGGNIGLETEPSPYYGIYNPTDTLVEYGANLNGTFAGVRAKWADDPLDHYAYLGSEKYGIYAESGNSDEMGIRYGGRFTGASQTYAYGLMSTATGYGADTSYGGYFQASNFGTGEARGIYSYASSNENDAYGGRFYVENTGTGTHYGVYASADDYAIYAANNQGPAYNYAYLAGANYGIYTQSGKSTDTVSHGGGSFNASSNAAAYGVTAIAKGYGYYNVRGVSGTAYSYGSSDAYGLYGSASASSGTAYGLYVASGSKSWVNPDPEDPGQSIAYVTIESGENLTYCRGTARLEDGHAEVELPDHFRKVTSPDHPITVQLTPGSAKSMGLAVTYKSNSRIKVDELYEGKGNYSFDYTVQGVRLGYEDFEPIQQNLDYVPFEGNQADLDPSETTTQEWYDNQAPGMKRIFKKNGTLDENGKVKEDTFQKQGWKVRKERAPKRKGPKTKTGPESGPRQ